MIYRIVTLMNSAQDTGCVSSLMNIIDCHITSKKGYHFRFPSDTLILPQELIVYNLSAFGLSPLMIPWYSFYPNSCETQGPLSLLLVRKKVV